MHVEAYAAMQQMIQESGIDLDRPMDALDVGGRLINSSTRGLFPRARWLGLDLHPGPGVDIVADAADWEPNRQYPLVHSTELLEHTAQWRECVRTMVRALAPGGFLFITCASTGRPPHGAEGLLVVPDGEHYANVDPVSLAEVLSSTACLDYEIRYAYPPGDAYTWGIKDE